MKKVAVLAVLLFAVSVPDRFALAQTHAAHELGDAKPARNNNAALAAELPNDLQKDLPQDAAKAKKKPADLGWLAQLAKILGPVFKVIFWGALVGLAGLFLYFIVREILRIRKQSFKKQKTEEPEVAPEPYRPDEKTARIVLEDADRLAAQGRFDEAVHMILFRSIQDISEKRPGLISRSLTSREIANLRILSKNARAGFALIGDMVEKSFFGRSQLNQTDFERSKQAYKDFAYEKFAR